jgi:hypothetical protein
VRAAVESGDSRIELARPFLSLDAPMPAAFRSSGTTTHAVIARASQAVCQPVRTRLTDGAGDRLGNIEPLGRFVRRVDA